MKHRPLITALTAGVALSVQGCAQKEVVIEPERIAPVTNPPPPVPPPVAPKGLPTWGEALDADTLDENGFPEMPSTNPPIPVLIVSTDGRCFVEWESARGGSRPLGRVGPSPLVPCGPKIVCAPEIQCTDEGKNIYAKWKDGAN